MGGVKIILQKHESELTEILKSKEIHPLIKIAAAKIFKNQLINEKLFSSKTHYKMYRKFRKMGKIVDMEIAPHYIIVTTMTARAYKNYWNEYKIYKHNYVWVFGINSDNKLFVNLILEGEKNEYVEELKPIIEHLNVLERTDEYVWGNLGYEIDSKDLAEITINEHYKTYRVQGEITMRLERNLGDFIFNLRVNSNNDVARIIENYLIRKTLLILNYMGFGNMETARARRWDGFTRIVIMNAVQRKYAYDLRTAIRIKQKLHEYLETYLGNAIKEVEIPYSGTWGNQYLPIIIHLKTVDSKEFTELSKYIQEQIEKKVKEAIANREKKVYTRYMGTHRITVESIPRTYEIEIPKELNPLAELYPEAEDLTVVATTQDYYVLEGFKATIYHPEHGLTTVKFGAEGRLIIEETTIHPKQGEFQNRIVVRMLLDGEEIPLAPF